MEQLSRRRVLAVLGLAASGGLAGCSALSGDGATSTDADTPAPTTTESQPSTATLTSTATHTATETETETETPTETETETPRQWFEDPVLAEDGPYTIDEVDTRFEDEVYQETIPGDDTEIASAVSDIDVDAENVNVDTVMGAFRNVYNNLNNADTLEGGDDLLDGVKYVLDENEVNSDQVLINKLFWGDGHPYWEIFVGRDDQTKKIITEPFDVQEGYQDLWTKEPGEPHMEENTDHMNWWGGLRDLDGDEVEPDRRSKLSVINFDKAEEYVSNRHKSFKSSTEADEHNLLGAFIGVFAFAIKNDHLVVGHDDSVQVDPFPDLWTDAEDWEPREAIWEPYQESDDIHYTEAAEEYIDDIFEQEAINDDNPMYGEDNRNIVTTASLFFHENVAENEETDMQVDYFETEEEIIDEIETLEEEEEAFTAYDTETGGYVLYTTTEAHGPFNIDNPPYMCETEEVLLGDEDACSLIEITEEERNQTADPDEINFTDKP